MLRELRIESYRGLREITMSDLGQVNILIGENNSGKTSVLEAIQLLDNSNVLNNMVTISSRRESISRRNQMIPFDMLLYSFPMQGSYKEIHIEAWSDKYDECRIEICGKLRREWFSIDEISPAEEERYKQYCDEEGMIRELSGEYNFECGVKSHRKFYFNEVQLRPQLIDEDENQMRDRISSVGRIRRVQYISPLDIYTGKTISASLYRGMRAEEKRRLLDLLRLFDERIIGIEIGVQYNSPVIFVELEDCGLAPISVFGDGLKKVLTLASAVIKMRGGIVLIDEFETGIHKYALIQVAKWLAAVTERYDVQIFLTTHSSDAIEALVQAQADFNNINAYRLEHYKGRIYVKQFRGRDLYDLKIGRGMDIL